MSSCGGCPRRLQQDLDGELEVSGSHLIAKLDGEERWQCPIRGDGNHGLPPKLSEHQG